MQSEILIMIGGLIGLWLGSNLVVSSGKSIAHRFGVSEMLIGLTIVSIGTSLPEIMVSIFSGAREASDIAIGSMVGSCLAQITLILGIAGLIHKITADEKALRIDGVMLLISIALFWIMLFTGGHMTQIEAVLLIAIYISYLIFTTKHDHLAKQAVDLGEHEPQGYPFGVRILFLLIGIALLIVSADIVLDHSILIAQAYGLSESFIGVMIVGVATCLPELSTAVTGAIKRSPGIAIGTLIGSNITDPLLSTSLGALFHGFEADLSMLTFDIPFWFVSSVAALLLLHRKRLTLSRGEASILVAIYALFVSVKLFLL
ncbi:hypothetical protein COW94_04270 [Candidatus Peregrinibacteria bacterium CG22_combo_CG10-13_8_21_14_all_44_10]|nr:MAG: hypothetical protein AUK45_04250 [Candidatus Peregrinibacteria bacterium CG2_30_44_17]PIP65967.1 MAG: hypothetical protein COW94_04270 [Candidatus Peregrinibacteria bacterium CG22_combo_CG10-13_8_21_14_all_44_10]PIS04534.1 MAG: hypothetical protein COT83_00070 [Candidatus Peregrinibacteria bacterium CG10_big_fil_rev_8_21_14_0_10_44_7]PIX79105.1 MAG: hypothetical protein COZ35_04100 [Candidatus Peregrinibacteria bacterium CG_4_10_14_3_um_filter_44_21]PJB89581.1 MAG: hypothetical protein 